ncbi:deoxyribonuclease Tat-D [Trichomonascus vanleenenianus]|uniref:3'-5'-exodeoxyribonuclease n=1 Tax=Trichomonascus vanleenenianus TaxID=2268995 RepID=UPI003EC9F99E
MLASRRLLGRAKMPFADIAANLTDAQFQGWYHGSKKHEADLDEVVKRAQQTGVEKIMVTGSTLKESANAIRMCREYNERAPGFMSCTVGVHPCHSTDFESHEHGHTPHEYLVELEKLANENKPIVKAFGEIGLDYDRLHFAPAEAQRVYFEKQLAVATRVGLPLFLHSRACHDDFVRILKEYLPRLPKGGVVHSFTGPMQEMKDYLDLGLYIGINGCSLKSEENLEIVKEIPMDRLLLETDGPWCEIRPSHASHKRFLQGTAPQFPSYKKEKFQQGAMVRGRCEPCAIELVAKVVAGVKGIPVEEVIDAAWKNSLKLFDL